MNQGGAQGRQQMQPKTYSITCSWLRARNHLLVDDEEVSLPAPPTAYPKPIGSSNKCFNPVLLQLLKSHEIIVHAVQHWWSIAVNTTYHGRFCLIAPWTEPTPTRLQPITVGPKNGCREG
eukprot:GHUV01029997.1.p1 GENE.GHUV01029997.1~~GHUV01029997.1.p1  ORF type:complete len:120 (+),score=5.11 GHUV01029997.1:1357-1716(+)